MQPNNFKNDLEGLVNYIQNNGADGHYFELNQDLLTMALLNL
jgi:hypothetical protein